MITVTPRQMLPNKGSEMLRILQTKIDYLCSVLICVCALELPTSLLSGLLGELAAQVLACCIRIDAGRMIGLYVTCNANIK